MSEQEKKVEIKEIIGAMLEMPEAQKQFMLGYAAGVAARKAEAEGDEGQTTMEPVPFNIDRCELILWEMED